MNDKEKKAFVARMKKGRKAAKKNGGKKKKSNTKKIIQIVIEGGEVIQVNNLPRGLKSEVLYL